MANKQNTVFIEKIKKLLRKGMTYQAIADKLGTYKTRISYYVNTWDLKGK